MYTPFNPPSNFTKESSIPVIIPIKSYVNEHVEITKRNRSIIDPVQPWREPFLKKFIYVHWKDTDTFSRHEIITYKIIDDNSAIIYYIDIDNQNKELIIPSDKFFSPTFDGKILGTSEISEKLLDYVNEN